MNVGDEIDTTCPRCRLILTHLILHFDQNGAVGRVQCRTCGAKHSYRSSKKGRIRRPPRSPKTVRALIEGGPFSDRLSRLDPASVLPYRPDRKYDPDHAIHHTRFGVGFILRAWESRIEVLFETGVKLLVQGLGKRGA